MDVRSAYKLAKELRHKETDAEKIIWQFLRNRKFNGFKFYRQHVIRYNSGRMGVKFFIADFYCSDLKLVIELDGNIHNFRKDYDDDRDEILKTKFLRTLRIRNDELSDIDSVLNKILSFAVQLNSSESKKD